MDDKFFSIQEAGNLLGVSSSTLRRWEEKGFLIPERTGGNQRRYSLSAITAFKNRGTLAAVDSTEQQQAPAASTSIPEPLPIQTVTATAPISDFSKLQNAHSSPLPDKQPHSTNTTQESIAITAHERARFLEQFRGKRNFFPRSKHGQAGVLIGLAVLIGVSLIKFGYSQKTETNQPIAGNQQEVLAARTKGRSLFGDIQFNIPAIFEDKVTIASAKQNGRFV